MHLALGVDHRILRFEVAIDDTFIVQEVEGDKETGDIVFDHIEGLSLDPANDVEHLLAVDVLHDELDRFLINGLLFKILLLDDGLLRFLLADVLLGEALDGEEVDTELHIFTRNTWPDFLSPAS